MIYKFVDVNKLVLPKSCYSVYVDDHTHGKKELLQTFNDRFHFNKWGWNWDALDDVCRDFNWLKNGDIYVVNKSLPQLNNEDMRIYLGSLYMYSEFWDKYPEHNFIVYFDKSIRDEIYKFCEQYKMSFPLSSEVEEGK